MSLLRAPATTIRLARRLLADVSAVADLARELAGFRDELRQRMDLAMEQADALVTTGSRAIERGDDLLEVGRENAALGRDLQEAGRENAALARQLVELGEVALAQTRASTEAMHSLDAGLREALTFSATLERELPALRAGLAAVHTLSESAGALNEVAPPIQAAAERFDEIAGRIPGVSRTRPKVAERR